MNACIDVNWSDGEVRYWPTCACGWRSTETQAIELAELDLLSHMDRAHRRAVA